MKQIFFYILLLLFLSGCGTSFLHYQPYYVIEKNLKTNKPDSIIIYKKVPFSNSIPDTNHLIIGEIISEKILIRDNFYNGSQQIIYYHELNGNKLDYEKLLSDAKKITKQKNGDAIIEWHFDEEQEYDEHKVGVYRGFVIIYR